MYFDSLQDLISKRNHRESSPLQNIPPQMNNDTFVYPFCNDAVKKYRHVLKKNDDFTF